MGRAPCCDEIGVKKGPWTPEEDKLLIDYIQEHGHGSWRNLPKSAGLNRCGKSCRLRWTNYLRPDIKRGKFTEDEERLIIHLHSVLGNKWSSIATRLEGRTDNEIKNYWNTHLKKKLLLMGIDPVTHRRRTDLDILSNLPSLLAAATNLGNLSISPNTWENLNALRLQADATHLAKVQIMQSMIQLIASSSNPSPTLEAIGLLGSSLSLNNNSGNNSTQFVGDVIQMNRQIEAVLNGSLSLGTQSLDTSLMFSGLQSQENDVNQMMNNNPLYDSVSGENSNVPALVSASPEHVSTCHGMGDNKVVCQNDVSGNSSNSKQFDAWENINTEEDYGWNDIFDQVSFTG